MSSNRQFGLGVLIFVGFILIVVSFFMLGPHSSSGVRSEGFGSARVTTGEELVVYGAKQYWHVSYDGKDELKVRHGSGFLDRTEYETLCPEMGCTDNDTLGFIYRFSFTRNSDGSVTVGWPFGFTKR